MKNQIRATDVASLVGRSLMASIFVASGLQKILHPKQTAQYMQSKNMRFVGPLLGVAALTELGGGLLVMLGYKPKLSASALAAFLVPTSLIFHNFWKLEGQQRQTEQINFMKNLAIIGGLAKYASHGTGSISLSFKEVPQVERELTQLAA